MRKCYILGVDGFLGKNLKLHQPAALSCVGINKKLLNFLEPGTFANVTFIDETIIDCINVNNGVPEDIEKCNVNGFSSFIDHLVNGPFKGKYVYISTISVLDEEAINASPYVSSKKQAEDILKNSGLDYQIIRISYPFGKNENSQRLLPRLKQQLQQHSPLKIKNIKLNLNYVDDVSKAIFECLGKSRQVFISNNKYVLLGDVVLRMKHKLNSKSDIVLENTDTVFCPMSETPYQCNYDVLTKLEEVIS